MGKTVIVYVTRTGHSRTLAAAVAARLGAKAYEIIDLVPRKGSLRYFWAGGQASMGKATPIKDPEIDLSDAKSVVLVQPMWASSVCPPLRTWLQAHKTELTGKKISLLISNLGSAGEPFKVKFESEFMPLTAFARIREKDTQQEKDAAIEVFCSTVEKK